MGYKKPIHGMYYHHLYKTWWCMVNRCRNPKYKEYHLYGGRGIKVCDDWVNSPLLFIKWAELNGAEPGLQLDRKENNGDYEPGNCHFTTPSQNAINRRKKSNNSSGYTGVHYMMSASLYIARISDKSISNKRILIACCTTLHEAVAARNKFIIDNKLKHPIQEIK